MYRCGLLYKLLLIYAVLVVYVGVHECRALVTDPYLHLLEYRMVLNPRKEDPHGVRAVVQEGDSCSVQLLRQFMDVCLQLCKCWKKTARDVD